MSHKPTFTKMNYMYTNTSAETWDINSAWCIIIFINYIIRAQFFILTITVCVQ